MKLFKFEAESTEFKRKGQLKALDALDANKRLFKIFEHEGFTAPVQKMSIVQVYPIFK